MGIAYVLRPVPEHTYQPPIAMCVPEEAPPISTPFVSGPASSDRNHRGPEADQTIRRRLKCSALQERVTICPTGNPGTVLRQHASPCRVAFASSNVLDPAGIRVPSRWQPSSTARGGELVSACSIPVAMGVSSMLSHCPITPQRDRDGRDDRDERLGGVSQPKWDDTTDVCLEPAKFVVLAGFQRCEQVGEADLWSHGLLFRWSAV